MDPRRILNLGATALAIACNSPPALAGSTPQDASGTGVPYLAAGPARPASPIVATGRAARQAAGVAARSPVEGDAWVGGVRVFAWEPGRIYDVWTAPLRVTTLTLAPGERLVSKAAGDTVRWQIGEAASGAGADQRTHVLLKPLERGLDTNLVLSTNRRVYLVELHSGPIEGYNAAIAWNTPEPEAAPAPQPAVADESVVAPAGDLNARYRIDPRGRRPRWTPVSIFDDGRRTFIAFDADFAATDSPVLVVLDPDGQTRMVNYRQSGGVIIVDRLFDRAELRLGDRRPQVVRLSRMAEEGR